MGKTADTLIDCCFGDLLPTIPVMADYFGNAMGNLETECIVLGLYQGLVKRHGVTAEVLHIHFLNSRLDELVHSTYRDNETGYYKKFCNLKLDLRTVTNLMES